MEAILIWRQLEPLPLIVHRIVLRHHPLFLHTQNIREMRAAPWHKRGARFGSRHGNAPVVGGEKPLGEVAIGRGHLGDPG